MLSAMLPAAYFTNFNLYCLLACRMVNVSMEYGDERRFRKCLCFLRADIVGSVFHRYREVFVSQSSHVTWSRSTASSPTRAKVLLSDGNGLLLDAADHDRDRFHAGGLSRC